MMKIISTFSLTSMVFLGAFAYAMFTGHLARGTGFVVPSQDMTIADAVVLTGGAR